MNKTIIANYAIGSLGKSSSIKAVFEKIKKKYNHSILDLFDDGDIRAIIHLTDHDIKIGLESQGDPNSRMKETMDIFIEEHCDIIIAACRTKGDTINKIYEMRSKNGYGIIWAQNIISGKQEYNVDLINDIYSTSILEIIDNLLSGKL